MDDKAVQIYIVSMRRFEFKKGLPCKHVIEIPRDSDIIPVKNNEAS